MNGQANQSFLARRMFSCVAFVTGLAAFFGCAEEPTKSINDPNTFGTRPAPVISSVTPSNVALAGVTRITITGQNFSSVKEENLVYFDATRGEVLSASPTQLLVKAPNLVKTPVQIKIAVLKSDLFSNILPYALEAAVLEVIKFKKDDETTEQKEQPWGIASDAEGNLYFSLTSSGVGAGVKKLTPSGAQTDFAPEPPGTATKYSSLKVGPSGILYGATVERRILQLSASSATTWVSSGLGTIYDFDFDAEKNLWAGGNNDFIYRVRADKNLKPFPFKANVRSVRIFNGHVYLAGNREGQEKVWRLPIVSADVLGPEEEYYDYSANYGGNVWALTFAADGDMYLGTDAAEAILVVHPNKTVEPLYSGLFVPKTLLFAWGKSTELFVAREKTIDGSANIIASQTILRINMQKESAPYYGRQ